MNLKNIFWTRTPTPEPRPFVSIAERRARLPADAPHILHTEPLQNGRYDFGTDCTVCDWYERRNPEPPETGATLMRDPMDALDIMGLITMSPQGHCPNCRCPDCA